MNLKLLCAVALLVCPLSLFAKGPMGIGKLEIGMPRAAVESLSATDGVYLSSAMTPYEYKYSSPTPGEEKYDASLVSPLSSEPLRAVLVFSEGNLKSIYVDLGDSSRVIDQVKELIGAKYGEPKVENTMKEEQCVYKNGANFKVSSGSIRHTWSQDRSNAQPITTSLFDTVIDVCPSNLRYGMGALKSRSLNIGVAEPAKPVANPF